MKWARSCWWLSWWLCGLCSLLGTEVAEAIPATATPTYSTAVWVYGGAVVASGQAACDASGLHGWDSVLYVHDSGGGASAEHGHCDGVSGGADYGFDGISVSQVFSCPSAPTSDVGSGYSCGTTYTCPSGYSGPDSSNQCTLIPTCPSAGTVVVASGQFQTTSPSSTLCLGGCQATASVTATQQNGTFSAWAPFTATGSTCTAPTTTQVPTSQQCPAGQVQGTVNGANTCLPAGTPGGPTNVTGTSSSTSSSTDGSGTTTTTPTTTSTSTNCGTDGSCSTTTTTSTGGGAGSPGGTTKTTTTPGTGSGAGAGTGTPGTTPNPSAWGGTCANGFAGSGDAVELAIAQAGWALDCGLVGDPSSVATQANADYAAGQAILNGTSTAPLLPRTAGGTVTVDSSRTISSAGSFGTKTISLPVIGAVTLDFTFLDQYIAIAGLLVLAVATLISARIVLGGV